MNGLILNKVKKQHYVPKFYLNRFSYEKINEKDKKKSFYVYKKQSEVFLKDRQPKAYATNEFFYDISRDFVKYKTGNFSLCLDNNNNLICDDVSSNNNVLSDEQYVENYFAGIENDVAEIFVRLDKDSTIILEQETMLKISLFLYDLYIRTEGVRNIISQQNTSLNDIQIKDIVEQLNKIEKIPI